MFFCVAIYACYIDYRLVIILSIFMTRLKKHNIINYNITLYTCIHLLDAFVNLSFSTYFVFVFLLLFQLLYYVFINYFVSSVDEYSRIKRKSKCIIDFLNMGNTASNSWTVNYRLLKQSHDDAYRSIDVAISLEEQERPNDAIEKYKEGILTIDRALDVVIACPDEPDETWKEACNMVQKMKKSRAEVLQRISAITTAPGFVQTEPPPAYQDVIDGTEVSDTGNTSLRTYSELAEALDNMKITTGRGEADILISCNNVVQYFISPDGCVNALDPQKLTIAMLRDESELTYFLQIGNWIFPLVPGVSPCYRTEYRAFIFPDVYSVIKGSSIGIVIPDDADDLVLEILEDILLGVYSDEKEGKKMSRGRREIQQTPGSSVATGIVTGAGYLSRGLVFTAQKVGDLLNYGTPKVLANMNPAPTTTTVPTNVSKTLKIAETTTGKAAEVTGVIAEKIGVATSKLGKFLAPHIERQGTKLLTATFHYSEEEASNKMSGVLNVAAGAVEGFGTVYQGLHTSAGILGQNLKDNSVKIVQHKYGESAGALANDTLGTVGNVISIRGNAKIFTPTGLAKNTVKQTGKAMIRSAAATTIMANAHAAASSSTDQGLTGGGREHTFSQPQLGVDNVGESIVTKN